MFIRVHPAFALLPFPPSSTRQVGAAGGLFYGVGGAGLHPLEDPMFAGTESFKPERKKTAMAFHAKDDLPEVRFRVFDLLRQCGDQLRFYAVVCDKFKLHESESAKRAAQPGYRFNENSAYDSLMRELFGKFHRLADRYEVCVAKRDNSTRNDAIKNALANAEADFEKKFGFRRSHPDAWTVTVQPSKDNPCLQAADYFLWALQRFYEIKWNAATKQPQLDSKTGLVIREDWFLNAVWPQVGEITICISVSPTEHFSRPRIS